VTDSPDCSEEMPEDGNADRAGDPSSVLVVGAGPTTDSCRLEIRFTSGFLANRLAALRAALRAWPVDVSIAGKGEHAANLQQREALNEGDEHAHACRRQKNYHPGAKKGTPPEPARSLAYPLQHSQAPFVDKGRAAARLCTHSALDQPLQLPPFPPSLFCSRCRRSIIRRITF
jgi:hypothetical protein